MSYEASSRPTTPQGSAVPVDFSQPASTVSLLDSSAARHRIAVKANACAKRKPVSRQLLVKRRDLRERVLLRDTEDKLRMVTRTGEEELEDLPGEQVNDSDHESSASGHEDEEVTDSDQGHKTSPTSSISAGDVSEGEEHVPAEDHVPKPELPESSWESPVTLELQADDFLLDTGCEVVPEEQGSLLEEVLSSLKNPLASGLALEHENMGLQSEVKDINSGSVVAQLEAEELPNPSNPTVTTEEQAPLTDSLSESSADSEEISEEASEEEELLEVPECTGEESAEVPHVDKAESANKDEELFESPKESDKDEVHEDVVEDEAELERGNKDGRDYVEKDDESAVVEPEKTEGSTNDVEPEDAGSLDETSGDDRESVEISVESIPESDQTVRDDVWSTTESAEASEPPAETLVLLSTASPALESPVLHSQFSNASVSPLERGDKAEPSKPDVSSEPQEVSSEKLEVVSEQQDQSPTREPTNNAEGRPRFTIAPAWQRSLASGVTQEQTISLILPEALKTNASSPQTTELFTPIKEEQPKLSGTSPTFPMIHLQEETSPENPFGVRLRKTPILHRYVLDVEATWTQTQTESPGGEETPDHDQTVRKKPEALPKKPDLLVDTVMSARKIPDAVGRISVGGMESPSWISLARQKQKNFIENSPENPAEKLPSQEDDKRPDSPVSLLNPITKEQLAQPCSPLQVCCSLELSNTSMLEKDSVKRSVNPSAAPLAQDEPPWLALAKKKAKAWSEMPQIVQ